MHLVFHTCQIVLNNHNLKEFACCISTHKSPQMCFIKVVLIYRYARRIYKKVVLIYRYADSVCTSKPKGEV